MKPAGARQPCPPRATAGTPARFQQAFVRALFDPGAPAWGVAAQPGFAVYRNTVLGGCVDALQANYPVVAALVGRDWFRAAATDYARRRPPTDARLMVYGEDFGAFLAGLDRAADLPYLPAVARLERLWREAHLAADAPVLDARRLQTLAPDALPRVRLTPHPAARWQWFDDAPARSLWQAHQDADEARRAAALAALDWRAEGVLVTRPHAPVRVAPAGRAACAFLAACAAGAPLSGALAAAMAETDAEAFDPANLLGALLDAGALRDLDPV